MPDDIDAGLGCRAEELDHTADVGLRLEAPTAEAIFPCAAQAMFDLLDTAVDWETPSSPRLLALQSVDVLGLLVDWLNELLFLYETTGYMYLHCSQLSLTPTTLAVTAIGYPVLTIPRLYIKAVTYHQLRWEETADGWLAEVFFDI